MTADEIKKILGLQPHPREGGYFIRTYESDEWLGIPDPRYGTRRRFGTAIYYLLEPDTFSEIHCLKSDEIFHFYGGDPVEMLQLTPDHTGAVVRIGNRIETGERPQIVVPRNVWQGSRLIPGGEWALLGCTVTPGFEYEDYEAGDRDSLCANWPQFRDYILALTHSGVKQ